MHLYLTGGSIETYIVFYTGLPINHCTHFPDPVAQ